MKSVLQIVGLLGVVTFLVGLFIRLLDTGQLLNASAVGWWRASIGLLTIAILFTLLEMLKEMRKK